MYEIACPPAMLFGSHIPNALHAFHTRATAKEVIPSQQLHVTRCFSTGDSPHLGLWQGPTGKVIAGKYALGRPEVNIVRVVERRPRPLKMLPALNVRPPTRRTRLALVRRRSPCPVFQLGDEAKLGPLQQAARANRAREERMVTAG